MDPIASLKEIVYEVDTIAKDVSNRDFFSKEDWETYQVATNQLVNKYHDLPAKTASLENRNMQQLDSQYHAGMEKIRRRLDYLHPENKTDIKFKFYSTQIEHFRLQIDQLKSSLEEGLEVGSEHENLFIPHNKARTIKEKIDSFEARIEEIKRKQAALY